MKALALVFSLLLLGGCAGGLSIDRKHPSANHDSRVQWVVVHYTSTDVQHSLELLTRGGVSSLYLIGGAPGAVGPLRPSEQQDACRRAFLLWVRQAWRVARWCNQPGAAWLVC